MDIGAARAASSQPPKSGTRLCRWERTRSMTTFKGHGRSTVSAASSTIARVAQPNAARYGRSRGIKSCAHRPRRLPRAAGLVAGGVRYRYELSQYPLGPATAEDLGLVVDARIPILHIQRVGFYGRLVLL